VLGLVSERSNIPVAKAAMALAIAALAAAAAQPDLWALAAPAAPDHQPRLIPQAVVAAAMAAAWVKMASQTAMAAAAETMLRGQATDREQ
jgi:hypothetical protein